MASKRTRFKEKGFDEAAFARYWHNHQAEYLRKRLGAVRLYHRGQSCAAVGRSTGIRAQTVGQYVEWYLEGGFERLCAKTRRPRAGALNPRQQAAFKETLLTRCPCEVGLEGNIWTGELMKRHLARAYGVQYRSGIYDLLKRMGLSHQRAHSDYGNADPEAQAAFLEGFKDTLLAAEETTAVVTFDRIGGP